jgi:hypothetical protein
MMTGQRTDLIRVAARLLRETRHPYLLGRPERGYKPCVEDLALLGA